MFHCILLLSDVICMQIVQPEFSLPRPFIHQYWHYTSYYLVNTKSVTNSRGFYCRVLHQQFLSFYTTPPSLPAIIIALRPVTVGLLVVFCSRSNTLCNRLAIYLFKTLGKRGTQCVSRKLLLRLFLPCTFVWKLSGLTLFTLSCLAAWRLSTSDDQLRIPRKPTAISLWFESHSANVYRQILTLQWRSCWA